MNTVTKRYHIMVWTLWKVKFQSQQSTFVNFLNTNLTQKFLEKIRIRQRKINKAYYVMRLRPTLNNQPEHGTIIRTRITCKEIPCYMRDSACRLFIVKKAKYFEVMLSIFNFSRVWENVECWLVYANKLFWIAQPYFSTDIIKRS